MQQDTITTSVGESYKYDANGNMTQRVDGGLTYNQTFDAENRLISVTVSGQTTQFIDDGDGKRVKSVMGDETILFIGAHYEVTNPGSGQTVTKYYFAGASRIAMRKYVIPQSMSVEYLLGDHLGSTSITTDSNGAKVSKVRYKPCPLRFPSGVLRKGETRFASGTTPISCPPGKGKQVPRQLNYGQLFL